MSLRKPTRRELLKAGLGLGAFTLMDKLGLTMLSGSSARAANSLGPNSGKPTKLLTIFVAGGWVPMYLWCPFTSAEILSHIPAPTKSNLSNSEMAYYTPDQVDNLDGSGDALDPAGFQKLRIPRTWDEEVIGKVKSGDYTPEEAYAVKMGAKLRSKGWSWLYHKLWENASVLHGVDVGTAAHASARVSSLCGIAGPNMAYPSMHAWVANAMAGIYGDARPLGSVNVGNTLTRPGAAYLPAAGQPTSIISLDGLNYTLSEKIDQAWKGLRNRQDHTQLDYWGTSLEGMIGTNDMDEHVMARTRALAGTTNSATDALFEKIYNNIGSTSTQLAKDVVSVLEGTKGMEYSEQPWWHPSNSNPYFQVQVGGSTDGAGYKEPFDLALRLLKSDLASAVHVRAGDTYFDDHSDGHLTHFPKLRANFELIGRFLAEMKATPIGGGKTLLDDVQVVIMSEFGRTWPKGKTCDHWPGTSVCFVGGNMVPNRMIGGYDLTTGPEKGNGFMGKPVSLVDEAGDAMVRPPQNRDVVYSVLHSLGIPDVFLPGGPGRVVGLEG